MSYDPSQSQGAMAIQIDVNGSTVLSDDVTAHTATSITSRCKYFIETKYYAVLAASDRSLVVYYNFVGFQWAGGTIRCSSISGTNSMTDDVFVGSNTQGVALSMQSTSSGSGSITTGSSMDKILWRIL